MRRVPASEYVVHDRATGAVRVLRTEDVVAVVAP
jgi:hypothetical protein